MMKKNRGHGFTSVDDQDSPKFWIETLDKLHREPFYVSYKRRIFDLLEPRPGGIYLDVGAGTGTDALKLSKEMKATVVALDQSRAMMHEATKRGLDTSVVGMAESIPFSWGTFDGCWSDRTFQHLEDPHAALDSMIRVTKSSGRIVVVDPDYDTQVLAFPDQELAGKVLRYRATHGLRNGTQAKRMHRIFEDHGLIDVRVEKMTLEVRDPTAVDNVMGLRTWAESAQAEGHLSASDVRRWETLYDDIVTAGSFFWSVTFCLTVGTEPD